MGQDADLKEATWKAWNFSARCLKISDDNTLRIDGTWIAISLRSKNERRMKGSRF